MKPLPRVLAPLVEASRARAQGLSPCSLPPSPRDFGSALRRPGRIALIAEFKRASPSSPRLRPQADPADLAARLEAAGAAALSVLTEPTAFGGSLDDLRRARAACRLPVLRKDFLVHPLQVDESAAAGADAVLLILRILDDGEAGALLARARELGIACLVEAHDAQEVRRGLALGAGILGVNARDLDTLRVDLPRALDLLARIPDGPVRVIESGILSPGDLADAQAAGADAALVGTALLSAPDPAEALRRLRP